MPDGRDGQPEGQIVARVAIPRRNLHGGFGRQTNRERRVRRAFSFPSRHVLSRALRRSSSSAGSFVFIPAQNSSKIGDASDFGGICEIFVRSLGEGAPEPKVRLTMTRLHGGSFFLTGPVGLNQVLYPPFKSPVPCQCGTVLHVCHAQIPRSHAKDILCAMMPHVEGPRFE